MEDEVEVFDFTDRVWIVDGPVLRAATRLRIKELKSVPIPGTGRKVPASALTPSGIYKPDNAAER